MHEPMQPERNIGTGNGVGAEAATAKPLTADASERLAPKRKRGTEPISSADALEILQAAVAQAKSAGVTLTARRTEDNLHILISVNAGQCNDCGAWRLPAHIHSRTQCVMCAMEGRDAPLH